MSIRSRERVDYGRVVEHAAIVLMKNCKFVVNERGRKKVCLEKRKNVHAFVRGQVVRTIAVDNQVKMALDGWHQVAYNPYMNTTFVLRDTTIPIYGAEEVLIISGKVYARGLQLSV